jgi:UV DNA damage endonuclease
MRRRFVPPVSLQFTNHWRLFPPPPPSTLGNLCQPAMAKRKRSVPALSSSGSAFLAAHPIPETSQKPPEPENVAAKDTTKPSRLRSSGKRAHQSALPDDLHGHDTSIAARRTSPASGKRMGAAPGIAPAAVRPGPERNIFPGAGTTAGGRADASAEAIAGAVHTSLHDQHPTAHENTPSAQHRASAHEPLSSPLPLPKRAAHVKASKPSFNNSSVHADTQRRNLNPSVKTEPREADGEIVEPGVGVLVDPETEGGPGTGDGDGEEEVREALSRPPPVNSAYLPLPWKGRLGYVSRPFGVSILRVDFADM